MSLRDLLPCDWASALNGRIPGADWDELDRNLEGAWSGAGATLPERSQVFAALDATPLRCVRVVILGQDPYPTPGDATGIAFSVRSGQRIPRALGIILDELSDDLDVPKATSGDLTPWTTHGVLLLNTVLTVPEGKRNGHRKVGWQAITTAILSTVAAREPLVVPVLWGAAARRSADEAGLLDGRPYVTSTHPSAISAYRPSREARAFKDSRPFRAVNRILADAGQREVSWSLT